MKIVCFGAGYVGGPTMAIMANKCPEHQFFVFDINTELIQKWQSGNYPVYEQGLEQYLKTQNNLTFTADVKLALKDCDIIFIAVNTPTKKSGLGSDWSLDISYIDASVRTIANFDFHKRVIIVEKSTVPVKTCDYIKAILKNKNFCVVSNPEFLAEGNAIKDLLEPDRVIIGGTDGIQEVASIYKHWVADERILFVNSYSSELSKIVANSFLAQRISSINSLTAVCQKIGANIDEISKCIGTDSRIGCKFLQASVGFGGSCLKKDLRSLVYLCESYGLHEVAEYWRQVEKLNEYQKNRFSRLIIESMFNNVNKKIVSIFGIAFKANTNDTRESAALSVIESLGKEQAIMKIYDPKADLEQIRKQFSELDLIESKSAEECIEDSHAIIILTEWEQFKHLRYDKFIEKMKHPAYIFDGRNILSKEQLKQFGYLYYSL